MIKWKDQVRVPQAKAVYEPELFSDDLWEAAVPVLAVSTDSREFRLALFNSKKGCELFQDNANLKSATAASFLRL